MWIMIDKFIPLFKVVVTKDDKKWITSEIKHLIAERQKAHLSQNYDLRDHLTKKIMKAIKRPKSTTMLMKWIIFQALPLKNGTNIYLRS